MTEVFYINLYAVTIVKNESSLIYIPDDPCGNNQPLQIESTTQGYIKSPNYPNDYPNNIKCSWKIQIGDGIRVSIKLIDLSIENV